MCHGHALQGSLKDEGEQEGAERVPFLHAAAGEDRGGVVWRPSKENPRRAAVRPRREKEGVRERVPELRESSPGARYC
jgi:hypothetical protein